jgi:glucan phosphoethanolaminetransferase (alkaline phosphatase superfamily)
MNHFIAEIGIFALFAFFGFFAGAIIWLMYVRVWLSWKEMNAVARVFWSFPVFIAVIFFLYLLYDIVFGRHTPGELPAELGGLCGFLGTLYMYRRHKKT